MATWKTTVGACGHAVSNLKKIYGLSARDYDDMLESQGGVCFICNGINPSGRMLSVDHDHKTEKIRGLLCDNCNHGIGRFQDQAVLLKRAASYLHRGELR